MHRSDDGLEDFYHSSWPYYTSLLFLENVVTCNTSSGNLDLHLDAMPSLDNCGNSLDNCDNLEVNLDVKPSLKNFCTADNKFSISSSVAAVEPSSTSATMNKKNSAIAEQILQMENKKYALLEKSLAKNPEMSEEAELDKLNMSFFQTLLPEMRRVDKKDILLCRSDISKIVYSYVYRETAWKSITDQQNHVVYEKKRKFHEDDGK